MNETKIFDHHLLKEIELDPKLEEVFECIKDELRYQELLWNKETTPSDRKHTITEFLVYINDYVNEALHVCTRLPTNISDEGGRHSLRKIAALAIKCMLQNGFKERILFSLDAEKKLHGINTVK